MRPDITEDMRIGWIALGVAVVIVVIAFFVMHDGGQALKAVTTAEKKYKQNKGNADYPLLEQIQLQREANEQLAQNIHVLKTAVGIKPVRPFALPPNYTKQKGLYFRLVYDIVVEYLNNRARFKRIDPYSTNLGFTFADGQVISEEQAEEELIRLQLTVRAMLLALSTPDRLQEITIEHSPIVLTGPVKRPPLLREYPFTLRVRGSLKDILWLLHQYASDTVPIDTVGDWNKLVTQVQRNMGRKIEPTTSKDHFPLILRGLRINSENSEPLDDVTQLDAEFELAGMEFLSDDERETAGSGAGGRRIIRGTGKGIQRF